MVDRVAPRLLLPSLLSMIDSSPVRHRMTPVGLTRGGSTQWVDMRVDAQEAKSTQTEAGPGSIAHAGCGVSEYES